MRLALTLPRSRSREYVRARDLAVAYPRTTAGSGNSLVLEADTSAIAELATIAAVLEIAHRWKGTSVEVDGKPLPPKDARDMLRCLRAKLAAPPEAQRWHCHFERYAPDLSLPMIYSAPCRFARRLNSLFWSDYVDVIDGVERTDHARLERAYERVSATSECRWCPGFSPREMKAFMLRLPHEYSSWRSPEHSFLDLQNPAERMLRRITALDPALLDSLQTTLDSMQREPPLTRDETLAAISDDDLALLAHIACIPQIADLRNAGSWPESVRKEVRTRLAAVSASFDERSSE